MQRLLNILKRDWWRFEWRYWRNQTPWNTGVTPPEVMDYLARTPPGRALDLGCGTGTNAVTLAEHGWQVTGIDFSLQAIRAARKKATDLNLAIDFHARDAADLGFLQPSFDYALDIGCLFNMAAEDRQRYAAGLAGLMAPSGDYMLYAWLPQERRGRRVGMSQATVADLFRKDFSIRDVAVGEDGGGPSAWYWLKRRSPIPV